jgi:ATP-dependent Clp protease ATP-binding subunit ClpC
MFERFTDHARQAVILAQQEARDLHHAEVGTEDLLIALMLIEDCIPARAMARLGVPLETARKNVGRMEIPVLPRAPHDVPFTASAKQCLESALREALQLGNDYIGPEHLLLGIIRRDFEAVNDVYCVHPGAVRQMTVRLLGERLFEAKITTTPSEPVARSSSDVTADIESLENRLRELRTELNAAIKRETGCDPSYHH